MTVKPNLHAINTSEIFFDKISDFYDDMINFDAALSRRTDVLRKFVKDEMKIAADLGCGSGLDSIALAKNGLEVTGFDISDGMLLKALNNAVNSGVQARFIQSSIEKISRSFNDKFDLAVSLGNALANVNGKMLPKALNKIYSMLNKNGTFVMQILNYSAILKKAERIINITERDGINYVRFYDFLPNHLNFNILVFDKNKLNERCLHTTKIYPHTSTGLTGLLKEIGFKKIKIYKNLNLEKFEKNESQDLVIVASK